MTAAREAVEAVARGEGPAKFRLFLGYAGWGPEQVEGEIAAGAWLPADADVASIFELDTSELWDASYRKSSCLSPMAFNGSARGVALTSPTTIPRQRAAARESRASPTPGARGKGAALLRQSIGE